MAESSDGTASQSPASRIVLKCAKCDAEFKLEHNWKKHRDKPPACCITEQARRARKKKPTNPGVMQHGSLRERLGRLRRSHFLPDHIPKSVRRNVAQALADVLQDVADTNSVASWEKLLLFSFSALGQPRSPPEERAESLPQVVRRNLREGNATISEPCTVNDQRRRKEPSNSVIARRVARKIADGDLSGAVNTLLAAETVLPATGDTLAVLRSKHPPGVAITVRPPEGPLAPMLSGEDIQDAVSSFRNGSAAGPDGLRPQYLKELLCDTQGRDHFRLLDSLAAVGNILLKGTVPEEIRPLLFGANLFAFGKKDGGVRPIAVGFTLRRLVAKVVCKRVRRLNEQLIPTQLGFATPRGVEAAVHATRHFLETYADDVEPRVLMKLDVRNAFNSVDRNSLLEAVKTSMPEYYPFIFQAYGAPSFLLCDSEVIMSAQGLQQGDPFSPVGYCITTAPSHRDLRSQMVQSYLDDDILAGEPQDVLSDLKTLQERSTKIGLEFNLAKCEMAIVGGTALERETIAEQFLSEFPQLQLPAPKDLVYLGAPLTAESLEPALSKAAATAQNMMERLKILPAHQAYHLLRVCMGPTKLLHILRCSRSYERGDLLHNFDQSVRLSLAAISNNVLDGTAWSQATLPISKSGVGIRRASELALPAFLASAHACQKLVQLISPGFDIPTYLRDSVEKWTAASKSPAPETDARPYQKSWDLPVVQQAEQSLKAAVENEPTSIARIKAAATKDGSAWLRGLPAGPFGMLMTNKQFQICMGLRLGAPVVTGHDCVCGRFADELGHHALDCGSGTARNQRHFNLNNTIARAFGSAGMKTQLEPTGLSVVDGKRPDGVTLEPFERGISAAWDATCASTTAISHLAATTVEAGAAANQAERRKFRLYEDLRPNYLFMPIGFETMGPWGREATKLLTELGKRIRARTGNARSMEFLRQRISMDIQRGNASCVMGTSPKAENLDDMLTVNRRAKMRE